MHGRKILLTMLAAALLVVAVADAAAQQVPAAPTQPARPPAPVGHRQPKLSDLPPELAQKEEAGPASQNAQERERQPGQRAIDESLRICKGC